MQKINMIQTADLQRLEEHYQSTLDHLHGEYQSEKIKAEALKMAV